MGKKRKSRDLRESGTRRFLRRPGVRILGILLVVGLFWVAYFFLQSRKHEVANLAPSKDSEMVEFSDFDQLLLRCSVSRLITESLARVDDPQLSIPVRYDYLDKRIQIADRLLEFQQDAEAQNFGLFSKIQALTQLELLNLDQAQDSPQTRQMLGQLVYANLQNEDQKTADAAVLGKALYSVLEFRYGSDIEKMPAAGTGSEKSAAIQDFQVAIQRSTDNFMAANLLHEIANQLNVQQASIQFQFPALLQAIHTGFSESNNPAIQSLAADAKSRLLSLEHPLPDVTQSALTETDSVVAELSRQIESILADENINADHYARLSESLENIVRVGRYDQARSLVQRSLDRIEGNAALLNIQAQIKSVLTRMNSVGNTFSIQGIVDIDGQAASLRPNIAAKVILFVHPDHIQQCVLKTNQLGKLLSGLVVESKASMAIVYLEDDSIGLKQLEQIKTQLPELDVWRIDFDSQKNSQFLERFPVTTTPFVLVLDRNDQVVGIDPPPDAIEAQVYGLVRSN